MSYSRSTVIKKLKDLEDNWPDGLLLFGWNSLFLVDVNDDYKILANLLIDADGGDPYIRKDKDGNEFIDFYV